MKDTERLELAEIQLSKLFDDWKTIPDKIKSGLRLAFTQGMIQQEILEAEYRIIELKNEILKLDNK